MVQASRLRTKDYNSRIKLVEATESRFHRTRATDSPTSCGRMTKVNRNSATAIPTLRWNMQDGERGARVVGENNLVRIACWAQEWRPGESRHALPTWRPAPGLHRPGRFEKPDLRPWPRPGQAVGAGDFVIVSKEVFDHHLADPSVSDGDQDAPVPLGHRQIDHLRRPRFMEVDDKTSLLRVIAPDSRSFSKLD